jgi:formylglycine-generating enzyme required for sulfatase activity
MPRILAAVALLLALPVHAEVNIDWVTVGDPGNPADVTGFGAMADEYRIGKYEVTNAQYAECLNAVADTDTNALYHTDMGGEFGGISRSGNSGSYSYVTISGRGNKPVNYVSFWDVIRFANWLHNGQPTGTQDNTTTEDGAYTITPDGIVANSIMRNAGAKFFIPTKDEWYKPAYFNGTSYFDYPAGTDTQTVCASPGPTANTANCGFPPVVGNLTDAGAYTASASPYGTFDQGGNVWEWIDAIVSGGNRQHAGGAYIAFPNNLRAGVWVTNGAALENSIHGFRVASLVSPPPFPQGIPSLSPLGLILVATGLLGFGAYRRGRK